MFTGMVILAPEVGNVISLVSDTVPVAGVHDPSFLSPSGQAPVLASAVSGGGRQIATIDLVSVEAGSGVTYGGSRKVRLDHFVDERGGVKIPRALSPQRRDERTTTNPS